jgi:hypothetical protein
VNRGGSWNNNAENCRAANRNNNTPTNRNNNIGFRLALQLTGSPDGIRRTGACPAPIFGTKNPGAPGSKRQY